VWDLDWVRHFSPRFHMRTLKILKWTRLALSVSGGVLLASAAQATNGYFSHGYGIKAQGLAGAGIALPQDGLAAATNPAGTALVASRLDAGLTYFAPKRSADIQGNNLGPFGSLDGHYDGDGKSAFFIPELGYIRQVSPEISVGLAIYGNGGLNTEYNKNPFQRLGAQGTAGVNLEQLFITPSVAYKLSPQHTVGVALNLAHQRFSAQGLSPFANASQSPTAVSNQGTDTSNGVGVRLGWTGQIAPQWRLGATWSSRIKGSFDKYKGLFADGGDFDIPANFGLGLAYQPTPDWTVAADYQVIQYSGVSSVGNPLSRLLAGNPLGAANGPGFGWKDVKVIKLGVQHELDSAWTLRGGYSHASQAVPGDQAFLNVLAPGVIQDHITAGATWKASSNHEWSAFYGLALSKTVTGANAIPASFGGGNVQIRLKENIFGISHGWRF